MIGATNILDCRLIVSPEVVIVDLMIRAALILRIATAVGCDVLVQAQIRVAGILNCVRCAQSFRFNDRIARRAVRVCHGVGA